MACSDKHLTQAHIKQLLDYNPDTGVFVWKQTRRKGIAAGCLSSQGYTVIKIKGKTHYAHRLAWLYMHGSLPKGVIDHRNELRSDNRADNLRDVGKRENAQNQTRPQSNNTLGIRGVSFTKARRFVSQISVAGVQTHLGSFGTAAEASGAYQKAKQQFHISQ